MFYQMFHVSYLEFHLNSFAIFTLLTTPSTDCYKVVTMWIYLFVDVMLDANVLSLHLFLRQRWEMTCIFLIFHESVGLFVSFLSSKIPLIAWYRVCTIVDCTNMRKYGRIQVIENPYSCIFYALIALLKTCFAASLV